MKMIYATHVNRFLAFIYIVCFFEIACFRKIQNIIKLYVLFNYCFADLGIFIWSFKG